MTGKAQRLLEKERSAAAADHAQMHQRGEAHEAALKNAEAHVRQIQDASIESAASAKRDAEAQVDAVRPELEVKMRGVESELDSLRGAQKQAIDPASGRFVHQFGEHRRARAAAFEIGRDGKLL